MEFCQELLTLEERNLFDEQQRKRLLASNLRTRIFDKSAPEPSPSLCAMFNMTTELYPLTFSVGVFLQRYTNDGRIEKAMAREKKAKAMVNIAANAFSSRLHIPFQFSFISLPLLYVWRYQTCAR